MAERCDICDSSETGPFKELVVKVEAKPAWLEGQEKLRVCVFICWGCWNEREESERATLIALAALNHRLQVSPTSLVSLAVKSLVRWL